MGLRNHVLAHATNAQLTNQRQLRSVGGLVAHPTTGLVGLTFFWDALPHPALVVWAITLALLGLTMVPEMVMVRSGRTAAAERLYVAHLYGHALSFAALPWLDPSAVGTAPTQYMLLVPLLAAGAGYTAVAIDLTDRYFRHGSTLGLVGASYAAAFVLAGQWAITALTILWTVAMSGVAHLGRTYRAELIRLREESSTRAVHDSLTGLANRTGLIDALDFTDFSGRGIGTGAPTSPGDLLAPTAMALAVVDLDRFKLINDALGHQYGDQVLIAVGERLNKHLPPDSLVARIGGDEFAAIIPCPGPIESLRPAILAALDQVELPITYQGREMRIRASAGLARVRPFAKASEILAEADLSMYRSKRSTGQRLTTFDASMRDQITRRSELEQDFRRALEDGEITFWGQPIARTDDLVPVGVELLARWHQPEGIVIGPNEFVPIAEETGLSVDLGQAGLRKAAQLLTTWADDPELHSLTVNVNISPRHLSAELVADVQATLELMGNRIDPSALGLEFVENGLISELGDDISTLHELRDLGVRLIIDDFGVGYSSLGYLRTLPMTSMKLDQSFIRGLDADPMKLELTRLISGLSETIGLPIVAEGVETDAELKALQQMGMSAVQGFGIARPHPIGVTEQNLRRLYRTSALDRHGELASIEEELAELQPANAAQPAARQAPSIAMHEELENAERPDP